MNIYLVFFDSAKLFNMSTNDSKPTTAKLASNVAASNVASASNVAATSAAPNQQLAVRQPQHASQSSAQPNVTTASAAAAAASVTTNNTTYRLPSDLTFQHASKLAIVDDKPIMMDYWTDSIDRKALIGVKDSGEKLLVKSGEEYTSPISKFYKSGADYIVVTENSIYLVGSEIPTRKIA